MPACARKYLIANGADCLVHTVSRCVRRSWLCGDDAYSGKNFDHRREWVRERARRLVGVFAIEVLAYAVMSNHSHFVLWCRPSVAAGWSAEEVARRWLGLFRKRVDGPTEQEVARAVSDAEKIELWRGRLGNVSWFMRCLNEWLARKANAEDECTGRFWEGRFHSQLLEDEGAVLACMAYVDLNPVRAKMAESLEGSRLTSVQDRICATRARRRLHAMVGRDFTRGDAEARGEKKIEEPTPEYRAKMAKAREEAECDGWLCRFDDGETQKAGGECAGPTVLGIGFASYLELLEWTGQCLVDGRVKGFAPSDLVGGGARKLLERMDLEVENWVGTVEGYGRLYCRLAGKVETLKRKAAEMGQKWVAGQRKSRGVFRWKTLRKAKGQESAVGGG